MISKFKVKDYTKDMSNWLKFNMIYAGKDVRYDYNSYHLGYSNGYYTVTINSSKDNLILFKMMFC